MIESFVDLTYRGLSLGRRIKLTQVRPSSGYLELPGPMPVGTHVAIATEDGVQLEATVSWVHEQVAGSDRAPAVVPGMVVVPRLDAPEAAAWWTSRVVLPDEEPPRFRPTRSRPVTLRPRSRSHPTPPPPGATAADTPAIIADLYSRVTAAAGVVPSKPAVPAGDQPTAVMNAVNQDQLELLSRQPEGEIAEHDVVDDGAQTMIMQSVDTAALGLDPGGPDDTAERRDADDPAGRTGERD